MEDKVVETTKIKKVRRPVEFKTGCKTKKKLGGHASEPLQEIQEVLTQVRHKLDLALKTHDERAIKRLITEAKELL